MQAFVSLIINGFNNAQNAYLLITKYLIKFIFT